MRSKAHVPKLLLTQALQFQKLESAREPTIPGNFGNSSVEQSNDNLRKPEALVFS